MSFCNRLSKLYNQLELVVKKFISILLGICSAVLITPLCAQEKVEQTLSIIKPDAVESNHIGAIIGLIEDAGMKVVALKMVKLSPKEASRFYVEHKGRPFYDALVAYMSSGPIVVQVLEGEDAVQSYRKLMGATNPANAEDGTIRKLYGKGIEANAVHGSDSAESAKKEISFFFKQQNIYSTSK